jgi:hypothetical protein
MNINYALERVNDNRLCRVGRRRFLIPRILRPAGIPRILRPAGEAATADFRRRIAVSDDAAIAAFQRRFALPDGDRDLRRFIAYGDASGIGWIRLRLWELVRHRPEALVVERGGKDRR